MDEERTTAIDVSAVLVGGTVLLAILCAIAWLRVARKINTAGQAVTPPQWRDLQAASYLTAGMLVVGVLAFFMRHYRG